MLSEFVDRQAANADLYELEDIETGQKRQYRIVSKATVTVPGTDLNKATLDPILAEIAGKLSANGGTMTGNFSGPGASGISRIGYPNQIGEVYALQAYLNGLQMRGNISPDTHASRDIGTSAKRFNHVYAADGNFSSVTISGTKLIESGTWTPVLKAYSGTDPTVSYSARYGDYVRIGRLVFVRCHVVANISNAGSGYSVVGGLPLAAFPVAPGRKNHAITVGCCYGLLNGVSDNVGATAVIHETINAITLTGMNGGTMRQWAASGGELVLSGFYLTA